MTNLSRFTPWLAIRPRTASLVLCLTGLVLGLTPWGCGTNEREKENLKTELLREIGVSDESPSAIVAQAAPRTTLDRVDTAWLADPNLPWDGWEIQYVGNEPVGFFHRKIERVLDQESVTLRLIAESKTRLRGPDGEVEQSFECVAFERENGEVIRFQGSVEIGPKNHRFEGTVREGKLAFQSNLFGRRDSIRIVWNTSDRGPFAIEQSLMRSPMQEGEKRRLRYFDLFLGRPIEAQLTAFDYFDSPTFDGKKENLLEIQINPSENEEGSISRIWVDRDGLVHKRYEPALDLMSFRCSRESAMLLADRSELAELSLRPIIIFGAALDLTAKRPVRYRVESIAFDSSLSLPSRTHQVVQFIKNRKLDVTVYPATQLMQPVEGMDREPSPSPEHLASSFVIQSNHPEIQRVASRMLEEDHADSSDPVTRRTLAFARGIGSRIAITPFDRRVNSANVTLTAGKGDSFDIAALLAAICRSHGIPARIAIGLRCDSKIQPIAMQLHAWTEIHDGAKWIPVDATLPDQDMAADRIKWLESTWNSINPYESILQVAKQLSTLEVSVIRAQP